MAVIIKDETRPYAQVRAVEPGSVRWGPGFWAARFEQCRRVTLPHLWQLLDDPERGHALTNLRIAAGEIAGEFAGTNWQDEWVYKWIEAASYVYAVVGDRWLDERMDEAIAIIARAQEPDGYIATQVTLRGWPRFQQANRHELYVMGHLLSAACAHTRATGKTTLLDVARRVGDFLHRTFVPQNGTERDPSLAHIQYNPSQIMGLVELYRTTGDRRYLATANTFIDMHGAKPGGDDHRQDRVPLREETQVVGHMVLATYLYAGATDVYLETGDESLLQAVDRLWHDLTERRMYVHGGVAPLHRGFSHRPRRGPDGQVRLVGVDDTHEAAGDAYDLPNSTAYNETCAQIGNVLWNWRLLHVSPEARYADVMELSLYNSILSGIGLDGASWFYTNPLRWYGHEQALHSNDAYERFQPGLRHICCPSNLARTIAGLHGYLYSVSEGRREDDGQGTSVDELWLHLYGASEFAGRLPNGAALRLTQETDYPWDGRITLTIQEAPERPLALQLRIPGWADGASIRVNGEPADTPAAPGTYARLQRIWRAGDTVTLELPLAVRLVKGHPKIEAARNHVAITRGPLVYCLESPDLPSGVRIWDIAVPRDAYFTPRHCPDLLGGVTVLEGEVHVVREGDWNGTLYRPLLPATIEPERLTATFIPYYAWANRGVSEMSVWLPLSAYAR